MVTPIVIISQQAESFTVTRNRWTFTFNSQGTGSGHIGLATARQVIHHKSLFSLLFLWFSLLNICFTSLKWMDIKAFIHLAFSFLQVMIYNLM